ncbi:MAG: damage-inducible protein DinB [Spirochaetaceae bacterium]|nr:damage-inducible protein DinB [Spirochaetaceae bacterium]
MIMKEIFVLFAKQNADANEKILSILNAMPNDEREAARGSYYSSLSGLVRHILGGTIFLSGLFGKALAGNSEASKALACIASVAQPPDGVLSEAQWKDLSHALPALDKAYLALVETLREEELAASMEVTLFGGKPMNVPVSFMFQQLVAHNIHHRGQISQILDSLKIDNNYSGISPAFLH